MTRDELRYVLDPAEVMNPYYPSETFRVLKNNELRRYGEYRTQRLVLQAWDEQEAATTNPAALGKAAWDKGLRAAEQTMNEEPRSPGRSFPG